MSGRVATRGPERRGQEARAAVARRAARAGVAADAGDAGRRAPPGPSRLALEMKYDGYRALSALSGGRVAMWTRNALDLPRAFPTSRARCRARRRRRGASTARSSRSIRTGVPRFQLLQQGASEAIAVRLRPAVARRRGPARASARGAPRSPGERAVEPAPPSCASPSASKVPPREALARVAARGLEGLIAKAARLARTSARAAATGSSSRRRRRRRWRSSASRRRRRTLR